MIRSFAVMVLLLFTTETAKPVVVKENSKVRLVKVDYSIYPLYDAEIYGTVRSYGYDDIMAKLIVAQARHETGTYKSRLFRKANNAFGLVKHRGDTLALAKLYTAEGRLAYAGYRSLEESTKAVILFLTMRKCPFKFKDVKHYSKWLKSINYYEAPEELYTAALKVHYKAVLNHANQFDNYHYENYHFEHRIEGFRLHYCLQWKIEHFVHQRTPQARSKRVYRKDISQPLVLC